MLTLYHILTRFDRTSNDIIVKWLARLVLLVHKTGCLASSTSTMICLESLANFLFCQHVQFTRDMHQYIDFEIDVSERRHRRSWRRQKNFVDVGLLHTILHIHNTSHKFKLLFMHTWEFFSPTQACVFLCFYIHRP